MSEEDGGMNLPAAIASLTAAGYTVTPPAPPVAPATPRVASTIADIPVDRWAYVARKVPQGQHDVWAWVMSVTERGAYTMAVQAGRIVQVTRRCPDGVTWLMARRVVL